MNKKKFLLLFVLCCALPLLAAKLVLEFGWFNRGVSSNGEWQQTEVFLLTATNALGCSDTVSFSYIIVDSFSSLFIPNIFTPNGDNLNDTFHFDELAILEISCTIFNRWGKEVYSWNELESGWDGKSSDGTELPEGSYIYVVKATGIFSVFIEVLV